MFEFSYILEFSVRLLDIANRSKIEVLYCGFENWHSIIKSINYISSKIKPEFGGIVISGGDSSKRHLVSPISIKLHSFLLLLANFNKPFLVNNILFNIEKKFLIPQFNFQTTDYKSDFSE